MSSAPHLLRIALLTATLALAACAKAPAPAAPAAPVVAPAPTAAAAPAPATASKADADGLVPGRDYFEIPVAMPFDATSGKIEVAEVFGYTCPHCAHFEPALHAWVVAQPADVHFVRVPAPFGAYWMPYARAYFAAQQLGLADKTHQAVFDAIHESHALPAAPAMASDDQLATFYAAHGANPRQFKQALAGPGVDARMKQATQFIEHAGVDSTPALVVDGKYRVGGVSPEDSLRITALLVARERAALAASR